MSDVEVIARYLSRLAHDIRNSASLLTLNHSMLRQEIRSERGTACLDDASETIRRLELLAKRLSQTLSPPSGELEMTDVNALLRECMDAAHNRRAAEGCERLDMDLMVHGAAKCETQREFLRCALDVVFDNALDALESVPAPREVSVEVTENPLRICVVNNGPTIPNEDSQSLFHPFFSRPHHSRFRAGLGLTRAVRFGHRVGGSIRYQPRRPGEPRFLITASNST